jgi:hypothetical protein
MVLPGVALAQVDMSNCEFGGPAFFVRQSFSPPPPGAPSALVESSNMAHTEDGLGADGSNVYTCSITIAVPKGRRFVVLTEVWNYAQAPGPGDCYPGCTTVNDIKVTLAGLPQQQTYTSEMRGQLDAPASDPWIPFTPYLGGSEPTGHWWYLNKVNAFDVSALTRDGTANLTLQVQIVLDSADSNDWGGDWWNPLGVHVGLYGGASLRLTQARSNFRPRDARDDAAQCSQNDGDCHPQFAAALTGLEQSLQGGYVNSPVNFSFSPSIAFSLAPATPGVPAGAWLPGTSTNYGTDGATDPDYLFETGQQQTTANLTVQSPSSMVTNPGSVAVGASGGDWGAAPVPTPSIPITVTSHDFGGKAYLRAVLTLGPGMPAFDAEIVDPTTQEDVKAPSDNQAIGTTCGTDFAAHPFASLPVDQDCNGIADWWEQQYIFAYNAIMGQCNSGWVPITAFNGSEDSEPVLDSSGKLDCSQLFGDGLTVADEYRGFHTWGQQPGTGEWGPVWTSTDPVGTQDAFYMVDLNWVYGNWPAVPANQYFPEFPNRPVLSSVNELLVPAAPGVDFHLVAEGYAGEKDPVTFIRTQLNQNSAGQNKVFVIEFNNADDQVQNKTEQPDPDTLGVSTLVNDGSAPIDLYPSRIAQYSAKEAFPVNVLQDLIVAHEAGHKLQLRHPSYTSTAITYDAGKLPSLPLGQYMVDPGIANTIHIALDEYGYNLPLSPENAAKGIRVYVVPIQADKPIGYTILSRVPDDASHFSMPTYYDEDVTNLYKLTLSSPPSPSSIVVNTLRGTIMDWTARLSRQALSDWMFTPAQLSSICVQSSLLSCTLLPLPPQ